MKILALDLGTKTGVAFGGIGAAPIPIVETHRWATAKEITSYRKLRMDRRRDPRLIRFFNYLQAVRAERPDVVVFEDVQFSSSTMQTQLWASFRTAVWLAFEPPTIIECVPTGTLKKFAGSGSFDKVAMSKALRWQYPGYWNPLLDDNAIDAIWIWLWAKKTFGRGVDSSPRV